MSLFLSPTHSLDQLMAGIEGNDSNRPLNKWLSNPLNWNRLLITTKYGDQVVTRKLFNSLSEALSDEPLAKQLYEVIGAGLDLNQFGGRYDPLLRYLIESKAYKELGESDSNIRFWSSAKNVNWVNLIARDKGYPDMDDVQRTAEVFIAQAIDSSTGIGERRRAILLAISEESIEAPGLRQYRIDPEKMQAVAYRDIPWEVLFDESHNQVFDSFVTDFRERGLANIYSMYSLLRSLKYTFYQGEENLMLLRILYSSKIWQATWASPRDPRLGYDAEIDRYNLLVDLHHFLRESGRAKILTSIIGKIQEINATDVANDQNFSESDGEIKAGRFLFGLLENCGRVNDWSILEEKIGGMYRDFTWLWEDPTKEFYDIYKTL